MTEQVRFHLGRSGRRLVVLLLVAVLAVPVVAAANRLRVHVDGDRLDVLSFAATVADLLEDEGVELAAGDAVLPSPSTPLDDVRSVTVLRTIEVALIVDGQQTAHRGTFRTVEGLLAAVGVTPRSDQVLRPGPRTQLADGDVVTIDSATATTILTETGEELPVVTHLDSVGALLDSLAIELAEGQDVRPTLDEPVPDAGRITIEAPVAVSVTADGRSMSVSTYTPTVGDLLAEVGVTVGERDLLWPAADEQLVDGTDVVVRRVTFARVDEEIEVPFEEIREPDDSMYEDEERIATEGEVGRTIQVYRARLVDGVEESRELVREEVVTEPVDQVVEVGTKERPPPPPPPSSGSVWYDLAACESGGRWDYNGSSGYDGGLQFHPETWSRNKPAGYPDYAWQATAGQQIEVGKIIQSRSGWGAWPSCAAKLGLL